MGELVSLSKAASGGLSVVNIRCDGSSVMLFIRRSKVDQGGKGAHIRLLQIPGSPICPVAAVVEYLRLRPIVAGSFLVHLDGLALSTFQFVSVLRRCRP